MSLTGIDTTEANPKPSTLNLMSLAGIDTTEAQAFLKTNELADVVWK
jgi:hypothetical protein